MFSKSYLGYVKSRITDDKGGQFGKTTNIQSS